MKKLTLNKETIANLSKEEMKEVNGLTGKTCGDTCFVSCIECAYTAMEGCITP